MQFANAAVNLIKLDLLNIIFSHFKFPFKIDFE